MAADREFRIRIPITSDAAGAKEATGALNEVEKAGQKVTAQDKEHARTKEFLGLKVGELKKLTRELSAEFPLAGMAARLMINPIAGAFTAAIAIFGFAKKALDDWNKELDEAGERAKKADFAEGIQKMAEAVQAQASAAREHADALAHLKTEEQEFQDKLSASIALLEARYAAEQKVANAAKGLALESINADVSTGRMSPTEAIIARLGIENKFAAKSQAYEIASQREIIDTKTGQRNAQADLQSQFHENAEKARAAANEAQKQVERDEARAKEDAARKEELDKARDKAQAALDKFGPEPNVGNMTPAQFEALQRARAGVEEASARFVQNEQDRTRREARLPAERISADQAKKDAERAEKAEQENKTAVEALTVEIKSLTDKLAILEARGGQAAGLEAQSRTAGAISALAGTTEGKDVERAAGIERLHEQHKRASDADEDFYQQFLDTMTTGAKNREAAQAAVIKLLADLAKTDTSQQKQLDDLTALVRQLAARIQAAKTNSPP